MPRLSDVVKSAWEDREGAVILTTVDTGGIPNAIYATCVTLFDGDRIVIANNFFDKTMENLQAGSKVSVLFITSEKKSYQIKGSMEYHTEGAVFEDMKKWNPEKHPGHGAAVVNVEAIYSGSEKIL